MFLENYRLVLVYARNSYMIRHLRCKEDLYFNSVTPRFPAIFRFRCSYAKSERCCRLFLPSSAIRLKTVFVFVNRLWTGEVICVPLDFEPTGQNMQ